MVTHTESSLSWYTAPPLITFLLSLLIGAAVGLVVAFSTETPWLGIVAGVGAMVLVWIIGGVYHYYGDFVRYIKIERM